MNTNLNVITLLGSSGGVAKSVLSILNKSIIDKNDPLHSLINDCTIHLIDIKQKDQAYYQSLFPDLYDNLVLYQLDLKDTIAFKKHLTSTKTTVVIDISWADTVEMLDCCNELGIKYVNSALENTMIDDHEEEYEGFPLIERIRYFEKYKNQFSNTTAITCSGMNPGVVQWMAIELLNKHPKDLPLGCYIVEHDTSFFKDSKDAKQDTIYTTWSPECFLDEAIMSYPMFMQHKTPLFLHEQVYDLEFKVSLGDKQFYGCLMPHEEVYTLCQLFNVEGGFLYKVNDHTTELIRENLDNVDSIWDFDMQVLDPNVAPLEGEDLIGVLLVFEDKEVYIYNTMRNEDIFKKYKTNATYFQVACGIYAALSVLLLEDIPKGVYYVDELLTKTKNHYGQYIKYYMKDFVTGVNHFSDGTLLQRMKKVKRIKP